jgi:hypothetical protein
MVYPDINQETFEILYFLFSKTCSDLSLHTAAHEHRLNSQQNDREVIFN